MALRFWQTQARQPAGIGRWAIRHDIDGRVQRPSVAGPVDRDDPGVHAHFDLTRLGSGRIHHCLEPVFGAGSDPRGLIANAQNISIRYLHKLFGNEAETVHALMLNKRLERARQLLNDPAYRGHSIERIAYSTGFVSAAHFSRSFKKHYGVCPSDVR